MAQIGRRLDRTNAAADHTKALVTGKRDKKCRFPTQWGSASRMATLRTQPTSLSNYPWPPITASASNVLYGSFLTEPASLTGDPVFNDNSGNRPHLFA